MLTELHIQNFAIIEKLDVQLEAGLATFTGETGAGKSIIFDAVEMLLGGRADSTLVRSGAESAIVEAIFRIPNASRQEIHELLQQEALLDNPDYLALGREIRLEGRNVARVNGRMVNTRLLRDLGEHLVDLHGQSEHLSLLRVSKHLALLDGYAASHPQYDSQMLLQAYSQTYKRLGAVHDELRRLRESERNAAQRADMLAFQIQEIESARLRPGEDETLAEERDRLANAEGLANLAQDALLALDEGTPESPAATDLFGRVSQALTSLARLDPSQAELRDSAQGLFENLSELASTLRAYLENIEYNPKRLDHVEERLALIASLKRKYGGDIPAVLEFGAKAQDEMDQITHAGERMEALGAEKESLLIQLGQRGAALSEKRRGAAGAMTLAIERELDDLYMEGAQFQVDFRQQEDPQNGAPLPSGERVAYYPNGLEKVEFLIAPNPGEGFKPLAKIASGGETSRLMLALKNVLAQADEVPTLIFDEIDQGIGGRIGAIVGQKLSQLGRDHQVLCVTHLPQLAAFGAQHFHVEKQLQGERTITLLKALQGEERLVELAQMLGAVSPATLQSAQELLQAVEDQPV